MANAAISIDTSGMTVSVDTLLDALSLIKGVKRVEVIGQN
jgi:ACT domain-containing protein